MTFGERVKELRKKNGYTQTSLAEKLGITKGTVSTWETNSRKPSFETLTILCDLFDVRMDYLIGQSDDATPPHKPTSDELDELALDSIHNDAVQIAADFEDVLQKLCATYVRLDCFGRESLKKHLEEEAKRCEAQDTFSKAGEFTCTVRVRANL